MRLIANLICLMIMSSCYLFYYADKQEFNCDFYSDRCYNNCKIFNKSESILDNDNYSQCLELCKEEFVACKTKENKN